ncbi:hypothetical protein T05_5697 [Trichinella murrelli]|uniref:Uncharacterized protein n=1 Tax=Trichinella murrelli TaxID=144512 RepID=A0A0V0U458_9BILA|nr:hypothetical protein T05_5697 [Trichinella murrelli]
MHFSIAISVVIVKNSALRPSISWSIQRMDVSRSSISPGRCPSQNSSTYSASCSTCRGQTVSDNNHSMYTTYKSLCSPSIHASGIIG